MILSSQTTERNPWAPVPKRIFPRTDVNTAPLDPVDVDDDAKNMTGEINETAVADQAARLSLDSQVFENRYRTVLDPRLAQGNHD